VPNTNEAVPPTASEPTVFVPRSIVAWRALLTRPPNPNNGELAMRKTIADSAGSTSTNRASVADASSGLLTFFSTATAVSG
jgi:hypothetical protein